jgi:hypothetical protein
MRTDGEVDRLLRDEAERWRMGVPAAGDVDAGLFTDVSRPRRIPRTLIAALSTTALAAVLVAVLGPRWLPAVEPDGTGTIGPPAAQSTPTPMPSPELPAECSPAAFLQVMRTVVYDYEPVDSPRKLARMSDLVVIGRVVAGTAVASETRGIDTHLAVHVSSVVRGDPDLVVDGRIFVEVRAVDVSSIDVIQKLSGCDVFLFLSLVGGDDAASGGESGPHFFATFAQGFWVGSEDGLAGVYVPLGSNPPGWEGISTIYDLRNTAGLNYEEREAAMSAIVVAANSDPDNFGVPYIDEDHALVIQYVNEAARAALEQQVTGGLTVRWEPVTYSQSELKRIAMEILDLRLDGVFGISAGSKENRVIVMVGPGGSLDEVSELLTARYGDAVRVEFSSDIPTVGG